MKGLMIVTFDKRNCSSTLANGVHPVNRSALDMFTKVWLSRLGSWKVLLGAWGAVITKQKQCISDYGTNWYVKMIVFTVCCENYWYPWFLCWFCDWTIIATTGYNVCFIRMASWTIILVTYINVVMKLVIMIIIKDISFFVYAWHIKEHWGKYNLLLNCA